MSSHISQQLANIMADSVYQLYKTQHSLVLHINWLQAVDGRGSFWAEC